MAERDGGKAFPSFAHPDSKDGQGMCGMSLRDYFAAAALQGYLAYSHHNESWGDYHNNGSSEQLACHCYKIADAMLAARTQGGE